MLIRSVEFVKSSPKLGDCPDPTLPEYAFIGRSNVGKSSLINMLTGCSNLAKTSSTPGKTQLMNFFIINHQWYLVDLPGYGYAKSSKKKREMWSKNSSNYLFKRNSLLCTFVLIDSRIKPQTNDLALMRNLAENGLAFVIVFTKIDKLSKTELQKNIDFYKKDMLKTWETIPQFFLSSTVKKTGRDEILDFIEETNKIFPSIASE